MAYEYLNALKEILMQGGVSDCDMEKGMVRCDVNVSVRPKGAKELGAKIEIKNMNSFSGVRRALEYEIQRQIEVLKQGGKLVQSTRRWDDEAGVTDEMRTKEHAQDYRYFPDPDLMPIEPAEDWLAEVKSRTVELPLARKQRFMRDYELPASDAQTLIWDVQARIYFEKVLSLAKDKKAFGKPIANWIINNVRAKLAEWNRAVGANEIAPELQDNKGDATMFKTFDDLKFTPAMLLELVALEDAKTISSSAAKQVFAGMFDTGKSPGEIVREKGLTQVSDTGAIEKFCDEVIAANPGPVSDFKSGKAAALNFLKGRVMKLSKGNANPAVAGEILERKLKA
jgi:aspartyl-tRNA(Asn)/glutamyl-tRNA(Gln) amidotransferase subunit B